MWLGNKVQWSYDGNSMSGADAYIWFHSAEDTNVERVDPFILWPTDNSKPDSLSTVTWRLSAKIASSC